MSRALESALLALARMKGDGDVSEAELRKVLAAALGWRRDGDEDEASKAADERPQ